MAAKISLVTYFIGVPPITTPPNRFNVIMQCMCCKFSAYFGYPKHCADGFLYSFSSRRIDCFSLSFLLSQIETAYFLPAKWHYADSE